MPEHPPPADVVRRVANPSRRSGLYRKHVGPRQSPGPTVWKQAGQTLTQAGPRAGPTASVPV
jgi:hypothetical protein